MSSVESPVALEFTLDEDDWVDGFLDQLRVVGGTWSSGRAVWPLIFGFLAVGATALSRGLLPLAAVYAVVGLGLWVWPVRMLPTGRIRRRLRAADPRIMQPLHVLVTGEGIESRAGDAVVRSRWQDRPYHVETARAFLLLGSDSLPGTLVVLPKRALISHQDAERLRTLLVRHTTRLERRRGRARRLPPAAHP